MDVFILLTISLLPLSYSVQNCPWRMNNMVRNGGRLVPVGKPGVVRSAMHCVHLCISTRRCDAVQLTTSSCIMYSIGVQSVSDTNQSSVFHVKKSRWPERFISERHSRRKEYETINLRKIKTSSSSAEDVEPTVSTEMKSLVAPTPMSTTPRASLHAENSSPPQRNITGHFRRKDYETINLRKMKTSSSTEDVEPTVSTVMKSLVAPTPMSTTPRASLHAENNSPPQRNITEAHCSKHEGFTYMSKVSMCVIYVKSYTRITWMEARNRCSDKGGDLVGMKSEKEYKAIHRHLRSQGVSGFLSGAMFRSGIWVGLQIHPDGGRWIDNSPLTYRKSVERPVNITHCVALVSTSSMMTQKKCSHAERCFLCEVTS